MAAVWVFGATSAIAEAACRRWAARGDHLLLVARREQVLERMADDLRARGAATVVCKAQDLCENDVHEALIAELWQQLGPPDVVLIAHGVLGDQQLSQSAYVEAERIIAANALSTVSLLTVLANRMAECGQGTLAVISSVAGDRGRQSNYVYGSAKAMVSVFLQGLRNRLYHQGVHVLTIKPGFVDTPMAAHLPKGLLWAQPETVAAGIVKAVDRRRNVVYLPGFWWGIMTLVRLVPEWLFKRLRL